MLLNRFEQTAFFESPVSNARLVGAKRAVSLEKLNIYTVCDLLENVPHRYIDATHITPLAQAKIGEEATVIGTVYRVVSKEPKPKLSLVEVTIQDESGILIATWFRQPWIARNIQEGAQVALTGKVEFNYGYKRMNAPLYEVFAEASASAPKTSAASQSSIAGRILPVHPTTAGVTTNMMRAFVARALEDCPEPLDYLPAPLRAKRNLMSRGSSLRAIHFPHSFAEKDLARERLAYDEIFRMQLFMLLRKGTFSQGAQTVCYETTGPAITELRRSLPFTLTNEQEQVIKEILDDLSQATCMNRMLSGDVGTGKTIVAAFALAAASDSNEQAVMMAPTEVLANQYDEKLSSLLGQAGVRCALLTGSTKKADRDVILELLASGDIDVLFGTHAVLENDVRFKNLSLAIVDEQHRFGVEQRAKLRDKGTAVNTLLMTATPIPRTLALALHGDLDRSFLHSRPNPNAGVATKVITFREREEAYTQIDAALERYEQAYIICPLIGVEKQSAKDTSARASANQDSAEATYNEGDFGLSLFANKQSDTSHDVSDRKAAIEEVERIRRRFPQAEVELLTGRMSGAQKAEVMARFKEGSVDILVSTTVVEVGVDVPNATVMIIEDAELFGLSQLHQLRGRIGRGNKPAQAFLVAHPKTAEGRLRMQAIESTSDGFKLAELDLRARREGDLIGSRQHGIPALRFTDIFRDGERIAQAHEDAKLVLSNDPKLALPQNNLLKSEIMRVFPEYLRLVNS